MAGNRPATNDRNTLMATRIAPATGGSMAMSGTSKSPYTMALPGMHTVSYTHLDVYKRQTMTIVVRWVDAGGIGFLGLLSAIVDCCLYW